MSTTQPQLRQFHQSQAEQVAARQQEAAGFLDVGLQNLFELGFSAEEIEGIGRKNCENMIGSVEIPVGLAGPVLVQLQLLGASGDLLDTQKGQIMVPLATTEGALVASVSRGAKLLRASGGVTVMAQDRGMTRAPVIRCRSGSQAVQLAHWLEQHRTEVASMLEASSSHLKFMDMKWWVSGRDLYLRFQAQTGQAMGMNMISIAVRGLWQQLVEEFGSDEVFKEIKLLGISSNMCTDKKPAAINRLLGRGWWAQAEAYISVEMVQKILKVSFQDLVELHQAKNLVGSYLAGDASQNMHAANVGAAFLAATGQDLAHVVALSQAQTSLQLLSDGGLYAAVTLPSVPLGTVGGGTWLGPQTDARKVVWKADVFGAASGSQPVEQLVASLATGMLAAELSGLAALANAELAAAHQTLGRDSK